MGQGHHTGKVVIVQWPAPHIRPDGRYLVTGGLGGLGLVFARALADAGARHLTLVGRRQPSEAATATIEAIRARGVSVEVASADVADGDSMAALLRAAPGRPAVRGILHAAGVLDDAPLAELDPARFEPVMAPKVRGTWHLHELSQRATVDFFVTFSSGAALLGSPGQGNYAAANAFMDGLASRRRSAGLHALSIAWGSWAGAGMAAGVGSSHRRRWAATGLSMIEPEDGVQMLWTLLNANRHAHAAALPLDRGLLPAGLGPFFSLLRSDRNLDAPTDPVGDGATDVLPRLAAAPAAERSGLLTAFLADQVVKVLALGASTAVDTQRSLMDLGMDSLMAMELRNRVEKAIGIRLAVADLLKGPTIAELAFDVTGRLADAMPDASSTVSTTDELHAWEEGTL
jgi:NAD(P)-dependent dehydrogenase (short-subunit alcohol dehydrogenase family)/aryl carrier-like protein